MPSAYETGYQRGIDDPNLNLDCPAIREDILDLFSCAKNPMKAFDSFCRGFEDAVISIKEATEIIPEYIENSSMFLTGIPDDANYFDSDFE